MVEMGGLREMRWISRQFFPVYKLRVEVLWSMIKNGVLMMFTSNKTQREMYILINAREYKKMESIVYKYRGFVVR